MTAVSQLTDEQAITAANFVVQEWAKVAGLEALALWQVIDKERKAQKEPIDASILEPKADDPEAAMLSRRMLEAFLDAPQGSGPDFHGWAQDGIAKVTRVEAHVLDPVSMILVGTLLIGLVLAARVKSVGPAGVVFYQGLPPSLSNLVKIASSMATLTLG
jgi:hypothetical protein